MCWIDIAKRKSERYLALIYDLNADWLWFLANESVFFIF